jgi:hypothetical protein
LLVVSFLFMTSKAKPEQVRLHVSHWGDEQNYYKWTNPSLLTNLAKSRSVRHYQRVLTRPRPIPVIQRFAHSILVGERDLSGILSPSFSAVLRFSTHSNLVGGSTGGSAGQAEVSNFAQTPGRTLAPIFSCIGSHNLSGLKGSDIMTKLCATFVPLSAAMAATVAVHAQDGGIQLLPD